MLSRLAATNTHGQDSSYFLGWEEYEKNPYHESTNPNGMIQMGLAENQLCFDLLESWLAENPDHFSFTNNDGQSNFRDLALFQDYHGLPEFKKAFVNYMSKLRGNKVTFDPTKLVLTAGATSANETVIFCLANPGEAILIPTPYYPGFDRDLKWRTGAEIVPINCTSSNGFQITKAAIEEAYNSAKKRGLKVKTILVTNPNNPLGTTLTKDEITLLLNFISSKNIHLISDEIYAGTVFNNTPKFISIMEALLDKKWSHNKDIHQRVHIVSSLSKDLGLPGFRVGSIYSNNPLVVSAAIKMSSFGLVSSQTQYLLAGLLSDDIFMDKYIHYNQKRLRDRHSMLVSGLKRAGITCLEGNGGLYGWVNMGHLLRANTFDAEIELWKEMVYEVKLNISPGSSCHCVEPGWFRVCFANLSEDVLNLAMQRIKDYVEAKFTKNSHNGLRHARRVRSLSKWVFQLSFDDKMPEER